MKLKSRHYLILEEMLKHPEGVTRKEIVELFRGAMEEDRRSRLFKLSIVQEV